MHQRTACSDVKQACRLSPPFWLSGVILMAKVGGCHRTRMLLNQVDTRYPLAQSLVAHLTVLVCLVLSFVLTDVLILFFLPVIRSNPL